MVRFTCRMQGCKKPVIHPHRCSLMMAWHCKEHYWAYVWRGYAYLTLGTVLILVSLPDPHGWWDKYCIVIGGLDYLAAIYHWHKWVHEP